MPKQQQNNSMVPFPGGLNTEANRFDYPAECTVDEQNFIITKDGKRERRLGIILGDEDAAMVPDGCEFNDVLRVYNTVTKYKHVCPTDSDHVWVDDSQSTTWCPYCNANKTLTTTVYDQSVVEDLEFLESVETYDEVIDVNKSATFTGLTTHTLTCSDSRRYVIQVYQNGAYVTLNQITALGGTTLIGKWFGSGTMTLPFTITKWESNQYDKPSLSFNISQRSTFNSELSTLLNKLKGSYTTKSYTWYSSWVNPATVVSEDANYGTWRGGWLYYQYVKEYYASARNRYQDPTKYSRMKNFTVNFSAAGFLSAPASLQWEYQSNYKSKGWSGSTTCTMPLGNLGALTTTYATVLDGTDVPTGMVTYGYKTEYRIRWKVTGTAYNTKNFVTLKDASGNTFDVTGYTSTTNASAQITTITGTEKQTVKRSKITATPSYEAFAEAMSDPTAFSEVMKANYDEYNNKTRIQIGKIASVADRTVPIHFVWKNAGGVQGQEFSVFYNQYKLTICEHSPPYLFNNVLYTTTLVGADDVACVDGRLVCCNHATSDIYIIEYDSGTGAFSESTLRLKVRDQWGLNESQVGNSKVKKYSGSSYHKYGGSYTIDITHNRNSSDTTRFQVLKTGGNTTGSFTWSCITANTIRVNYTQKAGKTKSTCSFTVIYTAPASGVTSLEEHTRCSPNQVRLYNLYNRGWALPRKDESGNAAAPITLFLNKFSKYPALNESVLTALSLNPGYYNSDSKSWEKAWERIYPELWDDSRNAEENDIESAPGSAIIDFINRGQSRMEWYNTQWKSNLNPVITSVPADKGSGGPSCCCDYAGRMFYAGFNDEVTNGDANSPHIGSFLLFSQLVRSHDDLGKCYQEGDPSSRTQSDIVDTDGGFVRISGAQGIVKLVQTQKGMLIFAQNGVWLLMGGSDYGFSATNHKVSKLTSFGVNHKYSICGTGDQWMYFSDSGIMVLAPDQFGDMQVKNISYNSIHTLFKEYAYPNYGVIGSFDPVTSNYHWMVECNSEYSTELIYNSANNVFTQNVFYNDPTTGRYVLAPLCLDEEIDVKEQINSSSNYRNFQSTLYLCRDQSWDDDSDSSDYGQAISAEYRVGYCGNTAYMDFGKQDAKAYMQSGPNNVGDVGIYKQTPWLNMYLVRTEKEDTQNNPINKSSCRVSVTWDWAMDKDTHRWTTWVGNDGNGNVKELDYFETYRHRQPIMLTESKMLPSYSDIVESRSKIRGRGKVLQFIVQTAPGFDCRIAGMNVTYNANKLK